MAYLQPPWFTRSVFNRLALATKISGSVSLSVRRRNSDDWQRIPVIPVSVDGDTYLVSTHGESDWVKNVRAHPRIVLDSAVARAVEIPADERHAVIDAYRHKAGRAVATYFRRLPENRDHPVFALKPAGAVGTTEAAIPSHPSPTRCD